MTFTMLLVPKKAIGFPCLPTNPHQKHKQLNSWVSKFYSRKLAACCLDFGEPPIFETTKKYAPKINVPKALTPPPQNKKKRKEVKKKTCAQVFARNLHKLKLTARPLEMVDSHFRNLLKSRDLFSGGKKNCSFLWRAGWPRCGGTTPPTACSGPSISVSFTKPSSLVGHAEIVGLWFFSTFLEG